MSDYGDGNFMEMVSHWASPPSPSLREIFTKLDQTDNGLNPISDTFLQTNQSKQRSSLVDRVAARVGVNIPPLKIDNLSPFTLFKNPKTVPSVLEISPGLSPSVMLQSPSQLISPFLFPNDGASETVGDDHATATMIFNNNVPHQPMHFDLPPQEGKYRVAFGQPAYIPSHESHVDPIGAHLVDSFESEVTDDTDITKLLSLDDESKSESEDEEYSEDEDTDTDEDKDDDSADEPEVKPSSPKRRKYEVSNMMTATRITKDPRVVLRMETEEDHPYDGYRWRKYGQKIVKGNPNPRSYYKCSHKSCNVKKHVERGADNVKILVITYNGIHGHAAPAPRSSSSSSDEILKRLDLENLCSVACVSTTLRSAVVSDVLPSLTALDLSGFSPEEETLNHVLRGCIGLRSLTLNCLRLSVAAVRGVIGSHLQELHLLRCSLLNSTVLASIGTLYTNLRVLTTKWRTWIHRLLMTGTEIIEDGESDEIVLASEILKRLDLENLCSVHAFPPLSARRRLRRPPFATAWIYLSLTLNCLRLSVAAVRGVIGSHLQELHLLRCSLLNSTVLASIGTLYTNLRVLTLEMADLDPPVVFQANLTQMLNGCPYLESLQLNIRGILVDATAFQSVRFSLPETPKSLRLQPLLDHWSCLSKAALLSPSPSFTLQSMSLVLDLISDGLIIAITGSLPQLVKLDLEDRPEKEPFPDIDLTYTRLQSLGYCQQLTSLSLVRICYNRKISFKRINDMGIFLLSEACKDLESVRLGGFPRVSDPGFASLLHSCRNLKRFEVRGASLLSDLAFHDVTGSSCSLQEVRLSTCPLITSEAVKKLGLCTNLELLDLGSYRSISDSCLNTVSALRKLISLNLAGADVTDSGMVALGKSDVPIIQLSFRGCKRVSDKGISHLLSNEGIISRTLSTLDLGHMPGISDRAIHTITRHCKALTELSIRSCFHVTDSSIEMLATRKRQTEGGSKQLRKLNVHNCVSLTTRALRWLSKPSFGLHWLGLGQTRFAGRRETVTATICEQRPWLTLCFDGCKLGCYDGWEFHTPQRP
ncbi:hypothetical protein Bca52824_033198 [Brassica carinata]|uniref:WRKY domain-containing protein n=1 Tax=Brassica carinata TaxID=52824 RepID=A0A8X7V730_BRACI|nr:hypothetical protein Bca52824_033198 [Brassica carinata]